MSQPVFNRPDTLLGVCEAIGQDLGFHANWLRVGFALGMFWSPVVMFAAYALLGVAVVVARWLTPEPAAPVAAAETPAAAVAHNDDGQLVLAEAA